ncbi:MAG: hypothetical protein ABIP48_16660, partial [Planctomycetota bacterium]
MPASGAEARFVRLQLPAAEYFHLDEVEVFRVGSPENVALGKPADQSSTSAWSRPSEALALNGEPGAPAEPEYPVAEVIESGLKLAEDLGRLGADVGSGVKTLREVGQGLERLADDAPNSARRDLYFKARWAVRR